MRRFLLFALMFLFAILSTGQALSQTIDLAPYLNLEPGRILVFDNYENSGQGWVHEDVILEPIVSLQGGAIGQVMLLEYATDPRWRFEQLEIWTSEQDGYHWAGTYLGPAGFDVFSPPVGPLDATLEVDVPSEFIFTATLSGESPQDGRLVQTLLAAGFPCASPAGNFDDCVLVQERMYLSGDLYLTRYGIWANGVGPVFDVWAGLSEASMNILRAVVSLP